MLAQQLDSELRGAEVTSCFSQVKDELVLELVKLDGQTVVLQAHVQPAFTCLLMVQEYARARKNTIDLWTEILGLKVESVQTPVWDRVLIVHLEQEYSLVFKLFGNRSNVLLLQAGRVLKLFRNQLTADQSFDLQSSTTVQVLDNVPPPATPEAAEEMLRVCKSEALLWLHTHQYFEVEQEERAMLWGQLCSLLSKPIFYVVPSNVGWVLTLFKPESKPILQTPNVAEALSFFFKLQSKYRYVGSLRQQLLQRINTRLEATANHLEQCQKRMQELQFKERKNEWADLLMANLHIIPPGATQVEVFDFYQQKQITLRIKEGLTPQQQAERWYKKARHKRQELDTLTALMASRGKRMEELHATQRLATETEDIVLLKSLLKHYISTQEAQTIAQAQFKTIEVNSYVVWIGRNAQNNDELLQAAHKDDLWLHARDVSGSHVIIRRKAGSTHFPDGVIEQAAAIAAWHSKRRTDSLCPVMVTPRKYVRKLKGGAPGQVRVEREKVVMVRPVGII
jgi:predicted ribosome quality control (RQC) complex YloA/Tae2 family protein